MECGPTNIECLQECNSTQERCTDQYQREGLFNDALRCPAQGEVCIAGCDPYHVCQSGR